MTNKGIRMLKIRNSKYLFILASFLILTTYSASTHAKEICQIQNAVYKPHPRYTTEGKNANLNFTLTLREPEEGQHGGAHRSIFFYFNAYSANTGEEVSTLRMADVCGNGAALCAITTTEGQFNNNDSMKELKAGLSFSPIALSADFFRLPYNSKEAPYSFIFPDTASEFYYRLNDKKFQEVTSEFVRFYTDSKVFPNFGGYDVWIFDHCSNENK